MSPGVKANPNIDFQVKLLSEETGFSNKIQFIVDTKTMPV